MRSIYAKLVIIITAIALLAVGFFEVVVYLSNRESYYATVEEFIANKARAAAEYYEAVPPSGDTKTDAINIIFAFADERCRIQVTDTGGKSWADTGGVAGKVLSAEQLLTAESFIYNDTAAGGRTMAYAVPLVRDDTVNGTVRVSVLLAGVDKELSRLTLQYALLGLGILAVAVLAGALLSATIVKPIRKVTAAAVALGAGDLTARAEVTQRDETGELAAAFNRMAVVLERAERLKSEFISQVSHELRTPLTSIQGWAATVQASDPAEWATVEHGLDIINTEAQRLGELVEELLDFSRLQAGAFDLKLSRVELTKLCRDTAELMQARSARQGIDLSFTGDNTLYIDADANRIKQILINLIDNAVKHTPTGGSITVSCRREQDKDKALITVTDTGEGIPEEVLPHVKEMFYRGGGRGAGLGLAICERLALLHGGELNIESENGQGTRVTLSLPIEGE